MYKIKVISVTPIEQNCRVLYNEETKEAVVVDAGGDADKIISFIEKNNLTVKALWLTHSHFDHCGAVSDLKEKYSVPLYGNEIEKEFRSLVEVSASRFGLANSGMNNCPEPDHYINDGDKLEFSDCEFEVLFTPGHSPGHVCFYDAKNKILLGGDAVFAGSIGRTDLVMGDFELLIQSIRNKILVLNDEVKILSGHGPDTSVGVERKTNPFLQD